MPKQNNYHIIISLKYLFIILTIFQCNSMYYYSSVYSKLAIAFSWQIILLVLYLYSLDLNFYKINHLRLYSFFLFIIALLVFLNFSFFFVYHFNKYIYIIVSLAIDLLLLVLYLVKIISYYQKLQVDLLIIFEKISLILSSVSLVLWTAYIIGVPTNMFISTFGWNKADAFSLNPGYFGCYFITQHIHILGIDIIRNSSIFMEPSMFSYMLMISLLIELFIRDHNVHNLFNYRILLLYVTILTTFSTTGIILGTFALFCYIFFSVGHSIISKYILFLSFPVLCLYLKPVFSGKRDGSNIYSSYSVRMNDISATLSVWRKHLFLGSGINNKFSVERYMAPWRFTLGHTGISTGLTTILAFGGILLAVYYLLPSILASICSLRLLSFALILMIMFIFVSCQGLYIFTIILAYFWARYICFFKSDNTR